MLKGRPINRTSIGLAGGGARQGQRTLQAPIQEAPTLNGERCVRRTPAPDNSMLPESLATWEGQGGDGHPRRQPLTASGLGQEIAAVTTTSGMATLWGEILFPEEDSGPLSWPTPCGARADGGEQLLIPRNRDVGVSPPPRTRTTSPLGNMPTPTTPMLRKQQ